MSGSRTHTHAITFPDEIIALAKLGLDSLMSQDMDAGMPGRCPISSERGGSR